MAESHRVSTPHWYRTLQNGCTTEKSYGPASGGGGGFSKRGEIPHGVPGLAREHHLLLFSIVGSSDR